MVHARVAGTSPPGTRPRRLAQFRIDRIGSERRTGRGSPRAPSRRVVCSHTSRRPATATWAVRRHGARPRPRRAVAARLPRAVAVEPSTDAAVGHVGPTARASWRCGSACSTPTSRSRTPRTSTDHLLAVADRYRRAARGEACRDSADERPTLGRPRTNARATTTPRHDGPAAGQERGRRTGVRGGGAHRDGSRSCFHCFHRHAVLAQERDAVRGDPDQPHQEAGQTEQDQRTAVDVDRRQERRERQRGRGDQAEDAVPPTDEAGDRSPAIEKESRTRAAATCRSG